MKKLFATQDEYKWIQTKLQLYTILLNPIVHRIENPRCGLEVRVQDSILSVEK